VDAESAMGNAAAAADEPKHPKKPLTAFFHYTSKTRDSVKAELATTSMAEVSKVMGARWKALTPEERSVYESSEEVMGDRERYEDEMVAYKEALEKHKAKNKKQEPLFNKVVTVADRPGQFFFVLTYLPDLQWTHLGQLMESGVYGPEKGKEAAGKIRWKLVPEGEAEEIDTSAQQCTVVKSKTMKRVSDADKEEWLILVESPEELAEKAAAKEAMRKKRKADREAKQAAEREVEQEAVKATNVDKAGEESGEVAPDGLELVEESRDEDEQELQSKAEDEPLIIEDNEEPMIVLDDHGDDEVV